MTAIGGVTKGTRSEERRVGKEGRFRGAPDHLKKKKTSTPQWYVAGRRRLAAAAILRLRGSSAADQSCDSILSQVRAPRVFLCSFFFFQAEDGIRDYKVTGVQTCALPISRNRVGASPTSVPANPSAHT